MASSENIALEPVSSPSSSLGRDPGRENVGSWYTIGSVHSAGSTPLDATSSPSSSRRRDPGGEDVRSRSILSSVHSGEPAPLEAVVVSDPVDDANEADESDAEDEKFRPGYEEGLLVILRRFARFIVSKRRQKHFEALRYFPKPPELYQLEIPENLVWARTTLSAITNRDEVLPQLPTDVSHPLLRRLVLQVNRRRHMSLCNGRRGPQEDLLDPPDHSNPGLLPQADCKGSPPLMTSRLFKLFRFLSGYTDQQQQRESLKAIVGDVTAVFPLVGSLRVTVCDLGDGTYNKFDTTLNCLTASESLNALYITLYLRILMVTRTWGKATLGESPLDVRLSAA